MNRIRTISGITLCIVILSIFSIASSASTLDYTLKIYGNANMDKEINDLDVQYVQDIIAGKADATKFADANNDGTVDKGDIEQIKQIIDGTESKIIIEDSNERTVTLPYPIQKVVCLWPTIAEPIQAMGAGSKIIAIDSKTANRTILLPEISKKPSVGDRAEPDIEAILKLKPDVVVTLATKDDLIKKFEAVGIPVVILSYGTNEKLDTGFSSGMQESKQLGYILDAKEGAQKYLDFYGGYLSKVENKVSQLSEKDRPKVLYTYDFSNGKIQSSGGACYVAHMIDFAGAKDITSDNLGAWIELDPEYPIKENPKFILYEEINEHGLTSSKKPLIGYGQSDSTEISKVVEKMKALPGFNTIDAVKNKKIYAMPWGLVSHCSWLATLYQAKIYHPELFGDMDVPAIHQEYIEKFLGLSPGAYKDSIFVYPTPDGW